MNHAVSVDASVAVKWVVHEPHTTQARALLGDIVAADLPIVAPPHLPGEVANAIYQRWRSTDPTKHLTDNDADEALQQFLALRIELVTLPNLYEQAFAFAKA